MTMQAMTLYEALSSIPAHWTKKGRRFPLVSVLAIALAAMLAGADSLMAIFRWGHRLSPGALQALGVDEKRRKAPCHATYHYVFKELSVSDLSRVLGGWPAVLEAEKKEKEDVKGDKDQALRHVAIDGKRLRGSHQGDQPGGVHVLYAFASQLSATLGSPEVPPDSAELIEVPEWLKNLPLEEAVVTGDAAFSFEKVIEAIREASGHYFLFVKGNQPEMQAEIVHAFGDDPPLQCHSWQPGVADKPCDPPDLKRVRTDGAPQVLAALRNAAIAHIHATGQRIRPAREAFAENK